MGVLLGSLRRREEPTKVPLDGGNPKNLLSYPYRFDISGQQVAAFATFASPSSPKEQLALVPVDSPANRLAGPATPRPGTYRHTHDGKAVVYSFHDQGGADNLWLQPHRQFSGKANHQLQIGTHLGLSLVIRWQQMGLVRSHTDSDVVILEESKP